MAHWTDMPRRSGWAQPLGDTRTHPGPLLMTGQVLFADGGLECAARGEG